MADTFYALLFRQKYIRRWAMMRNTCDETLSAHTAECAILTHALCEISNTIYGKSIDTGEAVLTALYHDASEVLTGDLPTPIKYYSSSIRESYGEIEKRAGEMMLGKLPEELRPSFEHYLLPDDNSEIHRIVKAADRLCAYIKCVEEEKSGSSEFRSAKESILSWLQQNSFDALDYFRENLLPAFELTLDEL